MHPRSLAHVGVAVPDLKEAIEWYEDLLGWTLLIEPRRVTADDNGYGRRRAVDVLGDFEEMTVTTLVTGNQVGVEVFEFEPQDPNQRPDRTGYFHVCVVDPDVEGLAKRIDSRGGEHHAEVWRLHEDDPKYRLTYCKDPYGNLIEIFSHNQEQMYNPIHDTE